MGFKTKRACAYRGCGNLTTEKYCYEHKHLGKENKLSDNRESAYKRGYDSNWQRVRQMVLNRNPMCQVPGCTRPATDIDHIIPLRQGGENTDNNLQALCHSHHSMKTAKDKKGF